MICVIVHNIKTMRIYKFNHNTLSLVYWFTDLAECQGGLFLSYIITPFSSATVTSVLQVTKSESTKTVVVIQCVTIHVPSVGVVGMPLSFKTLI